MQPEKIWTKDEVIDLVKKERVDLYIDDLWAFSSEVVSPFYWLINKTNKVCHLKTYTINPSGIFVCRDQQLVELQWFIYSFSYQGDGVSWYETEKEAEKKHYEMRKYEGQLQAHTERPLFLKGRTAKIITPEHFTEGRQYNIDKDFTINNVGYAIVHKEQQPANKSKKCFIFYANSGVEVRFGNCITELSPYAWIVKVNAQRGSFDNYTLCNWKFITDTEFDELKAAGLPVS